MPPECKRPHSEKVSCYAYFTCSFYTLCNKLPQGCFIRALPLPPIASASNSWNPPDPRGKCGFGPALAKPG